MKRSVRAWSALGALVVVAAPSMSCGSKAGMPRGAIGVPGSLATRAASSASASAGAPELPPPQRSRRIADLPDGTYGPYVGRSADRTMVVYAAPAERERHWSALALDAHGAPLGDAVTIAPALPVTPRAVVRPTRDGFVVAWIEPGDGSSSVRALALGRDGAPKGPLAVLVQAPAEIPYVDIVPTDAGLVALWAIEKDGRADLHAAALDAQARVRGAASVVAASVLAWQAVPARREVALAVVRAGKARASGPVDFVRVGADGRAIGGATSVSAEPTADADVDLVRVGERAVLAWTDRRSSEPTVLVASVDSAGKLLGPPRPLGPSRGDQALVALVAPGASGRRALVAWEEPSERTSGPDLPPGARTFRATTLGPDADAAAVAATIAFASDAEGVPEFAASADGFVAVTLAPACLRGAPCDARAPLAPTLVRFDDELRVVASEPVRPDALPGAMATMAWAVGCTGASCDVLAAGSGSPAPIAVVEASARATTWRAAARTDPAASGARAVAIDAIASGPHVADVAAAKLGDRTLVAWVTYFVPGLPALGSPADAKKKRAAGADDPGDPKKPRAATVALRALDARGEPAGDPQIVSVRGESIGGVALAAGADAAEGQREAALAWVAKDEGDLQVFVTRVGADGKRKGQQMLTREKGDATDVAIAWAGDGWVVAWVDARDGNGEVYAAKVDRNLKRVTPDVRVTDAPGDAADATIAVHGDEVWIGWVDARGTGRTADPFVARLAAKDLARRGAEVLVASTGARAHAPAFAALGDATALAWVEDAVDGAQGGRARFVWLDGDAKPKDTPIVLASDRDATALAVECGTGACRAVVGTRAEGGLTLEGLSWTRGAPKPPATLVHLGGSSGEDVSPVLVAGLLFFADDDRDGKGRVRRARIAWE